MSADGRYVVFNSDARNLVASDTNNQSDIFVHDRVTGETTRVSVHTDGSQSNGVSRRALISGDGRYVIFQSDASNLVDNDTNGVTDIFLHNRQTGATIRVNVDEEGNQAIDASITPTISSDGRYITFTSDASNLVAGDTNGQADVFVHDRITGETTRVSISSTGVEGNGDSSRASISADGRYVAFDSSASNLVDGAGNGQTKSMCMIGLPEKQRLSVFTATAPWEMGAVKVLASAGMDDT